jgi:hypothetical protein
MSAPGEHVLAVAIAKACGIPVDNLTAISFEQEVGGAPIVRTLHVVRKPDTTDLDLVHQTWQPIEAPQ